MTCDSASPLLASTGMNRLTLRPGPVLICRATVRQAGDYKATDHDVTGRAVEFLFEPLALDPHVKLADVFRLLDACPALRQVFKREFADELCVEARQGPSAPEISAGQAGTDDVEFLELHWAWGLDTATNEYSSVNFLALDALGPALTEDVPQHGRVAGERINWSISLTPVRELLHLSVRVRGTFSLSETDLHTTAYGNEVSTGTLREVTLGQVIHGLLHELSWHGGPEEQATVVSELVASLEEATSADAKLVDVDDLDDLLEVNAPQGFEAMFATLGDARRGDVKSAMRRMADNEPAGAWFDQEFNGEVVVRAQFRVVGGRQFRKLFWEGEGALEAK